jgi:ribosome-binding ATPase
VIKFDDFVRVGGWKRARELGLVKSEGRDYVVDDGDVIEFKIGA